MFQVIGRSFCVYIITSPSSSIYQQTNCTWSVPRSGYYHTWWECVVIHTMWYWWANRLYTWGGRHTDVCTCLACSSTWSEKTLLRTVDTDVVVISVHNYDSKIWLWALMASLCNRKYIPIHWWNSHYGHGAITWWQQMYRSCPHMLFMPSQAVMCHLHLVGEESVRAGLHGKTLKILQLLCVSWLITFYRWRNECSSRYWDTYKNYVQAVEAVSIKKQMLFTQKGR